METKIEHVVKEIKSGKFCQTTNTANEIGYVVMRFKIRGTWDWDIGNMLGMSMGAPRALACARPSFSSSRAHSVHSREVIKVTDGLVK